MLLLVVGSQYMIVQHSQPVTVTREEIAGTPVDRYMVPGSAAGVVIVSHGFAASKEMMRAWGYGLARQGFDTYVIDQPGHGDSKRRLDAWVGREPSRMGAHLGGLLDELVREGRATPGRIGLVGHSMGAAAAISAALDDDRIAATVAISSAYREALPPDRPANLLSLAAERDPAFMLSAVRAVATQAPGGNGRLGERYGLFADGSAREADVVPDRNHITIIFDTAVIQRAADWFHVAFGTSAPGLQPYTIPWGWVLAAFAGALGVLLTVASIFAPQTDAWKPTQAVPRMGMLTGLTTLVVAALSAVLATVYIRFPWLGLAVADYILPYFLTMATVLLVLRLLWSWDFGFPVLQSYESLLQELLRGTGVFGAFLVGVGTVVHMNLGHYIPSVPRLAPIAALAVGFWLYFAQEEALKKAVAAGGGPVAALVVGLVGKLAVVGTWLGATALPNAHPFLPLTIPVVLVVMVALEALSFILGRWRYPAAAVAAFVALVLAWTAGVTFPLV